tara:strand:- start:430 stop:2718 length:2289 start_codon:yes stop_codon:yes gene_type:complete
MNNIIDQKSNLAKLLATENVTVQHRKVQTASFNPKTRVLTLPIWKKMSTELYDLLLSHEVGHALWTPADGWHEAVCTKGKNYKAFLNVIEDARIEKKIKRKYPGLRRCYIKGFAEIMKMKLFGIDSFDELDAFIDRINVFTKSSYTAAIDFNDEEQVIIDQIQNLESWDDVIAMTDKLWDKAVEEFEDNEFDMNGLPQDNFSSDDYEVEEVETSDDSDSGAINSDNSITNSDDSNKVDGEEEEIEGKTQGEGDSDSPGDTEDTNEGTGCHGFAGGEEELEPNCQTDEMFRHNEDKFNQSNPKEVHYLSIPKPILKNIIVDAKTINERVTKHYNEEFIDCLRNYNFHDDGIHSEGTFRDQYTRSTVMAEFKKKNDRFISLMAKEFEMKKAATKYAKARLYTSGDIDINKIYKYKFDDQIFRKLTKLPKGKNHGMILTLDLSGSMNNNLKGSLEQICILTAFCKKVQIPFRVFGFTSVDYFDEMSRNNFSQKVGDLNLACDNMFLKEFIHSNMNAKDYKNAFENLLLVKNSYANVRGSCFGIHPPSDFSLGSTPLNQAIVALKEVITEFKSINQLDIVNTIFVHDGDANSVNRHIVSPDCDYGEYLDRDNGFIIQDTKTRFERVVENKSRNDNITHTLLEWLKHTTGTQVFGFFVSSRMTDAIHYRYVTKDGRSWLSAHERKEVLALARKQKFMQSNIRGFDSFFILNDSNKLTTDNENFEFEVKDQTKISTRNLASQFTKMNKAREVNRVLATKFVEKIAVKL